jgi:predicted porin
LAAAGTAFAQSTATISGSIQVGVIDTGAAGDTAQVASLGSGSNSVSINTVEDLGGGMRAGFSSQIRFSSATGDVTSAGFGNSLFHTANAYVSGGFGTVRAGKIAEASTCGLDPWGCAGGAALQAGVGVNAIIGAQPTSAVSFTTPTINGFSASYQTSLSAAPGVANTGRTNERQTLNIGYAKGPLSLQFLDIKGGVFAVAPGALGAVVAAPSATDNAEKRQAVGGSYNFGVARLSVLNSIHKTDAGATTADIMSIGATIPMGAYTILAGYNKDSKAAANRDTKIAVGVNYALSKRTTLGADLFKAEAAGITKNAVVTPGNAGTGFVIRVGHTF